MRALHAETASSSLGEILGFSTCDVDDCYQAMEWLVKRQEAIEDALAKRHLAGESTLVLYDVSPAAFEGRTCPLGALGHPKDGVHGRLQIVYGLLTAKDGTPIAIEVFAGNTADPKTVASQVAKLKERFGLSRVCLVGDQGMLTKARLRDDVSPTGLDYLSALRAPEIKNLVSQGAIQLGLFDETDLFEVIHPDFPGERLVACKNPLLGAKRARKRESLLGATETELGKVAVTRDRRPLRGADRIALRVGRVLNRFKTAKHFDLEITDDSLTCSRKEAQITAEAALDGIYVLRTSVSKAELSTREVVSSYKALAGVERAFRAFNTDLDIRHRTEERVRAHVFLRMLSYYVTLHMERSLAPMLFRDDDHESAEAERTSPVAPARRSERANAKASTKRTAEDIPTLSFQSLLANLATIVANQIQPKDSNSQGFTLITTPTELQSRAFELLGVSHRLGYL